MKKKSWMLFVAVICGMSSFVVADDCQTCNQSVTQEEKKDETQGPTEVVIVDSPVVSETTSSN